MAAESHSVVRISSIGCALGTEQNPKINGYRVDKFGRSLHPTEVAEKTTGRSRPVDHELHTSGSTQSRTIMPVCIALLT